MADVWDVVVKSGETVGVEVDEAKIYRLDKAYIAKEENIASDDPVYLYSKVDEVKHLIGIFYPKELPELNLSLFFHKDFSLSHNLKDASVCFSGVIFDNDYGDTDEEEASADPLDDEYFSGVVTYSCCGCDRQFGSRDELLAHKEVVHFSCSYTFCWRNFKSWKALLQHQKDKLHVGHISLSGLETQMSPETAKEIIKNWDKDLRWYILPPTFLLRIKFIWYLYQQHILDFLFCGLTFT